MLKRSQMLNEEQLKLVKQIDTFYQQHTQQSVKKLKKYSQKSLSIKHPLSKYRTTCKTRVNKKKTLSNMLLSSNKQEKAKHLDNNRNVNKLSNGSTVT
jgi:hypothetical protein